MSTLKVKWGQLRERFDARNRRERALLALMTVGGILLLGFSLLIDPFLTQTRTAARTIVQARNDQAVAQEQLRALRAQLQTDPDAALRAEMAALKNELAVTENSLKQLEHGFVSPEEMTALLEHLLSRHAGLRLLRLKSLVPVNIAEQATSEHAGDVGERVNADKALPGFGLYRHGVELQLEGTYAELHGWLSQLEKTPQKVLWGDLRFSVVEHPRAVLTVTVFTLSLDKAWLAI